MSIPSLLPTVYQNFDYIAHFYSSQQEFVQKIKKRVPHNKARTPLIFRKLQVKTKESAKTTTETDGTIQIPATACKSICEARIRSTRMCVK